MIFNQKVMILAIGVVFLLAISTSCAADNTTEIMENPNDLECVEYTNSILKDSKTFSDLYTKINNTTSSEIYLDDNYTFNNDTDSGLKNGIYIKRAMTIYGNGSTIDGGGIARIFLVYDNIGSVVFKDIVFVNGKNIYEGGAIKGKATVIDCIFRNNHANDGGAIYGETTAIKCIFTNNSANWGAATHGCTCINSSFNENHASVGGASAYGKYINCSFKDNWAEVNGGAVYVSSSSFENCSFKNNSAFNGGAIYGAKAIVVNCTFTSNCAEEWGGAIYGSSTKDCIFINNNANEGGAIYADGKTSINCIFKNNSATNGGAGYKINASCCQFYANCASENGGAIFGGIVFSSNFTNNRARKEGGAVYDSSVADCLFEYNCAANGGAMSKIIAVNSTFNHNVADIGGAVSNAKVSTDSKFTNNTVNDTINVTFFDSQSLSSFSDLYDLISTNESVIYLNKSYNYYFITDARFKDGIAIDHNLTIYGNGFTLDGENSVRIFKVLSSNVVFRDIVFINSNVFGDGGAVWGNTTSINCTFKNNHASYGGALYSGSAINCTFTSNYASSSGGAISNGYAKNCIFTDNVADACGGAMNGISALNCTFKNNTAMYGGAINIGSAIKCIFETNYASSWGGAGCELSAVNCIFKNNCAPEGGAIVDGLADSCIFKTDCDTLVDTDVLKPDLNVSDFTSVYISDDKVTFNLTAKSGFKITDSDIQIKVYENDVLILSEHILSGDHWMSRLDAGSYFAVINATEFDVTSNITLKINKLSTKITASGLTTVYNGGKYLYMTLKDEFSTPIKGAKISVKIKSTKTVTTDKNGNAKLTTNVLAPKTSYTAIITFAGDTNHIKSTKSVKITVKKATPKLTAKTKSFKRTIKTKKYQVILKTNKNKAMKKTKIILKVNGKTYHATTNSYGKAIFKITKLTKKGKFTAVIKYNGSKYYKEKKIKAKLTVK
ncbi:hypothetical protein [uncultured Methanobrevibacter sp.]|uniref:hypothetical protein n=1 Tax=uncultured Methanobrevibacter sp. TaxID=253161 RepID=UPI0025EA7BD8|nr:hypothetical protein [uncultured Methanobrevibacter sp.]